MSYASGCDDGDLVLALNDTVTVRGSGTRRAGTEVLEVEIRWPDPAALAGLFIPMLVSVHVNGCDPADQRH